MKVLHINSNYIWSTLHQLMIRELSKMKVVNSVFVPSYRLGTEGIIPDENVTVSLCFKKWDRLLFDFKQKKILNSIKSSYDISSFDIIHAYTLFTDGNCAWKLSKEYGVPYVVAVRNTDINSFFKKRLLLRNRGIQILINAEKVFFLSVAYREELLGKYIPTNLKNEILKKAVIIPNGIDDFWLNNKYNEKTYDETERKIRRKKLSIVYAGVIDSNKNIELTIAAIKQLVKEGWNISFTVVGKIADEEVYNRLMQNEFVHYLKNKPKEELIEIYRLNDIFVMPSKAESFGLVYAEAMTQGLPVIYTRGQGFDGQFDEGTVGYSVDSKNPDELKEKIVAITNSYKRISKNCLAFSDQFKWETIAGKYIKTYSRIISKE